MQPTRPPSPAAAVLALVGVASACGLTADASAQSKDSSKQPADNGSADGGLRQGLPPELVYIPGGRLTVGTDAKYILDLSKELAPHNETQRELILRVTSAELGQDTKDVAEFFLYRTAITNAQYKVFVEKTGWRFPYHWWYDGRRDDVDKRREEIRKKPYEGNAVLYWEDHWKDLPYQIPVDAITKEPLDNHPVVHVSWKDAQAFAGWAGMRLPTEEEWLFAAKGTKDPEYLLGEKWDPMFLHALGMATMRDRKLKAVSPSPDQIRVPTPFGVADMVGNVWEWTANDQGFQPFDRSKWQKEWEKLRRDKFGAREDVGQPAFDYNRQVCKGGAVPSADRPWELRVDARAGLRTEETMEWVTFRVAKSTIPGRDMAKSMIRIKYDYSIFGEKREPLLSDQIGVEHYDIAGKLINDYHAISLVPVNHFGDDKRLTHKRLEEDSQSSPVIIGTVLTTVALVQPKLKPGIYTLAYRAKDIPPELTQAIKEGMREVAMARRAAAQGRTAEAPAAAPADADSGKPKKDDWRAVVRRFGITEEQLADKNFLKNLDKIKLTEGDLEIPIKENLILFRDNEGNYVASVPTPLDLAVSSGTYGGAQLAVTEKGGKDEVQFKWGVELSSRRYIRFELPLRLDVKFGPTWRIPPAKGTYTPAAGGTPSNGAHGSPTSANNSTPARGK